MAFNPGTLPSANITQTYGNPGSAGIVPGVNFGAIYDKYVNGNQAADIFPNYNFGGAFNPPAQPQAPIRGNESEPSAPSAGNGGGGGSVPYVDPLKQQQNTLLSALPGQLGMIFGSSQEAARNAGLGIDTGVKQYGLQQRQAQNAINQKGIQNEASRRSGQQDILGMVGRGIESGGRILANKNAGTSSATGEIARAYGNMGQREMSKVGNQYELANQGINQEQQALKEQQDLYKNTVFQNNKEQIVGSIVSAAQSQLAELDTALRGASLPDRIAIEGEKNKIRDSARAELAKFDAMLANEINSAQATTQEQNRSKAVDLANMGQAPAGQFDYTTEAPVGFQGPAPAGGNLPIFTFPRGRRQGV